MRTQGHSAFDVPIQIAEVSNRQRPGWGHVGVLEEMI